jgi:hypothetical protein
MRTRKRITLAAVAAAGALAVGTTGTAAASSPGAMQGPSPTATAGASSPAPAPVASQTGTAAASSPGSAPAPSQPVTGPVTWTALNLINGWTVLSGPTYGTPSYAVRNGVLYLSGILSAPPTGAPEVAVLPPGARPAHYLWLSYLNFGADNVGEMEIQPDGEMFIYGSTTGGPAVDPSLAAISFPLSS